MRALLYVSKAAELGKTKWFSRDLSLISHSAKVWNEANGITGFLTYYDGLFLQYIEGQSKTVSELSASVFSDPRHNHFNILLDCMVDRRSFSTWQARLIGDLKKDNRFGEFIDRFDGQFITESREVEILAEIFDIPTHTLSMVG